MSYRPYIFLFDQREIYEQLKIINYAKGYERSRLLVTVVRHCFQRLGGLIYSRASIESPGFHRVARRGAGGHGRSDHKYDQISETNYVGGSAVPVSSRSSEFTARRARPCDRHCTYFHFTSRNKGQHVVACC